VGARHSVTFLPDEISVEADAGRSLLAVAADAGIALVSSCGGEGVCGKCAVRLLQGRAGSLPGAHAAPAPDLVLACQTTVQDDLTVEVPVESRRQEARVVTASADEEWLLTEGMPLAERLPLRLDVEVPDRREADATRLRLALEMRRGTSFADLEVDLPALRQLPLLARRGDAEAAAIIGDFDGVGHVIALEPPAPTRSCGLAIDVGTTTVVVGLIDLNSGRLLGSEAELNGQARYGADVISRIIHSQEHADGLEELREAIGDTVNRCIERLLAEHGLCPDDLLAASVVGNTVMAHLLLGIDPAGIRREPYVPAVATFPTLRAGEAGLLMRSAAPLFLAPCVSSYVGGDITAGLLAGEVADSSDLTLFIDLGTNGEIVVAQDEWIVCCSCSAGPAFEGSGLSHGTFARAGAVEGVRYQAAADRVELRTIGDAPAIGICGSGYVDTLAELLRAGVIDRSGHVNQGHGSPRVRVRDDHPEFVLARAAESGTGEDITITEDDIRNLVRSKAAVYSGMATLLEKLGLAASSIERLFLAGGFGTYLDVHNAITIGLLPDIPQERIRFLGNTAFAGARRALLGRGARLRMESLAGRMTNLDLSLEAGYMERYVSSLFLPHTDLSLFPSVTEELVASGNDVRGST
jgi:uncharacterized 2Fe-2S/4Fe-4S cluster protein (DUF4445 family)